ncbi:MAG: hypothetical protein MZV64_29285 [Ignavibacteriales bacterium]|nr:hypothetical protein [Ignavibacteriales bacterium]
MSLPGDVIQGGLDDETPNTKYYLRAGLSLANNVVISGCIEDAYNTTANPGDLNSSRWKCWYYLESQGDLPQFDLQLPQLIDPA